MVQCVANGFEASHVCQVMLDTLEVRNRVEQDFAKDQEDNEQDNVRDEEDEGFYPSSSTKLRWQGSK